MQTQQLQEGIGTSWSKSGADSAKERFEWEASAGGVPRVENCGILHHLAPLGQLTPFAENRCRISRRGGDVE